METKGLDEGSTHGTEESSVPLKVTMSTSLLSDDDSVKLRKPSAQTLRRRKAASAMKIQEKGDVIGETVEEIQEDFQNQLTTLMQSQKLKPAHAKAKQRVMVVFLPTYRLEPVKPFRWEHAQKLMLRVLKAVGPKTYDEATVAYTAQALSKCIINVVKLPSCNSDRYKLACHVRIIEKRMQGYAEKLTALWEHEYDKIISASIENYWVVVSAVVSVIYFN